MKKVSIDHKYNEDRYIVCPITGSKLIFQKPEADDWDSPRPRDGGYKYRSESDPNIGFKISVFEPNKFWMDYDAPFDNLPSIYGPNAISREEHKILWEKAKELSDSLKAYGKYKRVFILRADETWEEYIYVSYRYLPADSSLEDILKAEAEDEAEYERKKALYLQDPVKNGPFAFRVKHQTIAKELVEVKPLPPPTGSLYYLDVKYG
jgi:hypothetical protein